VDSGWACLATARAELDPLETAFQEEFTSWLAHLYAVRTERLLMARLQRLYGAGWLAVTVAVLAVPVVEAVAAVVAVVLLVATLALGWRAANGRDLVRRDRTECVAAPGPTASELPPFGPDERAQLVRLMNLSRAAWRPATRMLLRAELRDARSRGPLANWGPLYDLEEVVLADAFGSAARRP